MSRRLYVPPGDLEGTRVALTGEAHRHLARVLRAGPGTRVTLFDGTGTEVDGEVVRVTARATEVALGARRSGATLRAGAGITLLTAIPRGERMDFLIQKTSELGVARIVPVVTGRSVVRPDPGTARHRRWEKIAREAARQCGRVDVPVVETPRALADALAAVTLPPRRLGLWEAERERSLRSALGGPATDTALLIGPEGGLAAAEVAAAREAGFVTVGLGPLILRVETAAVVAVALAQSAMGNLD